ncbi:unnamed protein product [Acanthoscelides obtectus]|uniref:Translation initiation factor eIF2B subunit delta n=2 Tax=Acanthoscelides obtectus TaxID=200917 RepID=A0A9P0JMF6_ACAOB|nr:unnamed protein product [Acanthoscelides obtectus]CAK1642825.1 Translation initiation factor eIF-2B subunit delta [Acanthoscelides obtectus]
MDKTKTSTDGSSKKEKKHHKKQSKDGQLEANLAENEVSHGCKKEIVNKTNNDATTGTVAQKLSEKELRRIEWEKKLESQKGITVTSNDQSVGQQPSEKELRRLEWEKKLQEQKAGDTGKETLSKAEIKAKRREQQEAQRQAKLAAENAKNAAENVKKVAATTPIKDPGKGLGKVEKKLDFPKKETKKTTDVHKVQLVQHLYAEMPQKKVSKLLVYNNIHPAFVKLGSQYLNKTILGSNARTLALMAALKHLIIDIQTPPKQELCRHLETVLQTCTNHLQNCRPFAVSMVNALRNFKLHLTQVDTNLKDSEKKAKLQDVIDVYIHDDIYKAGDAISLKVKEKISDGDVILIYGCSSLLKKILVDAHKEGKKFKVIVADSRPLLEGKEMLRRLVVAKIECTYIFLNAVSYVMNSVTKVLLGAHALLTNGYVMSRIGTAQVALVAKAYNKPVLVCCETYKFSERVQTDSFVYNEIGDPDLLSKIPNTEDPSPLSKWKENNKLTPLNLLYDVTPPDFVTAVVTEIAILPCTSVPVVLRINAIENT